MKRSDDYIQGFSAGLAEVVRLRIEFLEIEEKEEEFYVLEAMRINQISFEDIVKAGTPHEDILIIGKVLGEEIRVLKCN